jgi:hypothetical protein
MDELINFFLVGYITLPTVMGFGTGDLSIWAAFNFGMLLLLVVITGVSKSKKE